MGGGEEAVQALHQASQGPLEVFPGGEGLPTQRKASGCSKPRRTTLEAEAQGILEAA